MSFLLNPTPPHIPLLFLSMDTDSIDYGMEYDEDSLEETQQTQSTQQASQPPESDTVDEHLWGYLQPCSAALTRIDFWRIHPKYSIGRNTETNQVVLPGFKVSNSHCIISWDGVDSSRGGVLVTDLSSNGTFINGEKIGKQKTRILNEGNEIAFGTSIPQPQNNGLEDYRFVYRHVAGGPPTSGLYANYDIGLELGKGSFATVRKAVHRETGTWYAVKMIGAAKTVRQSGGGGRDRNATFAREIHIMEQLEHRNICKLVETFFQDDGSVNLVLELVEGGDLLEYILKTGTGVEELPARDITYQICDALAYIHSKGITHRDLKPENVLLTRDNPPLIKVADFGLAKVVDSLTMLRTMCGTPSYLAPEVVTDAPDGYDNLVDSWSVGVIVFSMLTNQGPFQDEDGHESVKARILNRHVEWEVLNHTKYPLSIEAKRFIGRLLEDNPRQRMSLTSGLSHPWLRQHTPFHGFVEDILISDTTEDVSMVEQNPEPLPPIPPAPVPPMPPVQHQPALDTYGPGPSRTRLQRRQLVEEGEAPVPELPEELIAYALRGSPRGNKKRVRSEFTPLPEEVPDAEMSSERARNGGRRSTTSSPSDGQSSEGRPRRTTRGKVARKD
ncbi:hypothetical protein D9619_001805 [Psilocybe cf. subviscida]|uniref:Pkinase-domain-containing protein n=1 Tax=Psilocybe cf. subviscida TaxID=2480587 RepID=A0A8H5BEX0_9AGAR|nr:hypothetical protein D9619_001805 [Psilocybe cf. subviscida]